MFLRCKIRRKDGKAHRSWSLVENRRVRGGRVVQRQVLYLGEINDSQQAAWRRTYRFRKLRFRIGRKVRRTNLGGIAESVMVWGSDDSAKRN